MKFLTGAAATTAGLVAGAAFAISPVSAADAGCPPMDPFCHASQGAKDLGGDIADAAKKSNPFNCNDKRGCEDYTEFDDPQGPSTTSSHPAAQISDKSGVTVRTCGEVRTRSYDEVEVPFTVTNNSGESIDLYWLDSSGNYEFLKTLESGSAEYTSRRGDAWEVTDSNGECIWQFVIGQYAYSASVEF
ncbi:hypothetical protein AB0G04_42930 [Actinoplanes sp. NPDC023801]|uniref:hypothetical protein n=1 Tax=Actinoplanes sp. NPDC023801 TaxID=3154595 RepID=UPI00340455B0